MKLQLFIALAVGAVAAQGWAADDQILKTDRDKVSYSMGLNIGKTWKQRYIDVDLDLVLKGIKDVQAGRTPLLDDVAAQTIMTSYSKQLNEIQAQKRKEIGEKNKLEGEKFLAENKTKPGVVTLPDGLQYKIINEGSGPSPTTNDTVTVNYRGTTIDGTEFDSSAKHGGPAKFPVTGVIKGWTEALPMMKTGAKWQLFIPSDLAYREYGSGPNIGPNAALIFETELVSFKPTAAPATPPPPQPVTSDIIKVPSAEELKKGAKIEVIKPEDAAKQISK